MFLFDEEKKRGHFQEDQGSTGSWRFASLGQSSFKISSEVQLL
jgi:hypothetical protein